MPELNLNDLAVCVKLIDNSAKQGLIVGSDLEVVGGVRRRLVELINNGSQVKETDEEKEDAFK